MAATSDGSVTNGRARSSGHSIVIAGDRTASRRIARRHSRSVKILKIALPLTALATVAISAVAILKNVHLGSALPDLAMPQIVADNLKMQNPHYEGFNSDGGRYWVKAQSAQQDAKSLTVVRLDGITGELTDANKKKTNLAAKRGLYDTKAGLLELYDQISVVGEGGLKADLTRASIKTKEGIVTSDQPSTVSMPAGQINSNQMTIRQKTKEYTFVDSVRMHLQPKAPAKDGDGDKTANPLPFGKPGEPIDVASNRLDVDDNQKTALFTGRVVATQAGATMTSPELTVTYEGTVAGQAPGAAKTADTETAGTKLKLIVARDSVVLEQPSGETATSRTATFDPEANTAILEGDVVLTQGSDKRAVGDRAEYDQAAQTLVLTGPVVVTQGQNVIKGRRLTYDRTSAKMHLTSPDGPAAGRITAHFMRAATKAASGTDDDQSTDDSQSNDGISFGGSFKTDPKAPFDLLADKLDVDDTAKAAVFTGNVVATQGDQTIRAQELTAFYSGSASLGSSADPAAAAALTHIRARKKVAIVSKDGQTATGDWVEVDVKKNLATLGGAVVLTQGKNIVKGTKVDIDMNTGQATIKTEPASGTGGGAMISSSDGDGSGQIIKSERPSAVFYPGELVGSKSKPAKKDGWQVRTSP